MKPMKANHEISWKFETDSPMHDTGTVKAQTHSENDFTQGRSMPPAQPFLTGPENYQNLGNQANTNLDSNHNYNEGNIFPRREMGNREIPNQYQLSSSGWGHFPAGNHSSYRLCPGLTNTSLESLNKNPFIGNISPNMQGFKSESLSIPVNGMARFHQRRKSKEIQKNEVPEPELSSSNVNSALSEESVTNGLELLTNTQSIEVERNNTKYIAHCLQHQITKLQEQITAVQSEIPETQMSPEKADQLRSIYQDLEDEILKLKVKKQEVSDTYINLTQRLDSLLLQKTKLKKIAEEIKVTLTNPMNAKENTQEANVGGSSTQETNMLKGNPLMKKLKYELQQKLDKLNMLRRKLRIEAQEKMKPRTIDLDLSNKFSEPMCFQGHGSECRPPTRNRPQHRGQENDSSTTSSSNEQLQESARDPMKLTILVNDKTNLRPVCEDLEESGQGSDESNPDTETVEEIFEEENRISMLDDDEYFEEDFYMADVSDSEDCSDQVFKPSLKIAKVKPSTHRCNLAVEPSSNEINSNNKLIRFDIQMSENTKPTSFQFKLPTSSETQHQDSKKVVPDNLNQIPSENLIYRKKEKSQVGTKRNDGKTYRVENDSSRPEDKRKQKVKQPSSRITTVKKEVSEAKAPDLIIKLEVNNNVSKTEGMADKVLHKLRFSEVHSNSNKHKQVNKVRTIPAEEYQETLETLYTNPSATSSNEFVGKSSRTEIGSECDLAKSKELMFGRFPTISKTNIKTISKEEVKEKQVWIPNNTSSPNPKKVYNSGLSLMSSIITSRLIPSNEVKGKFVRFKEGQFVHEADNQLRIEASPLLNSENPNLPKVFSKPRVPSHIVPPLNSKRSLSLPPVHLLSTSNIIKKPSISNLYWVNKHRKQFQVKDKQEGKSEYHLGVKKREKLPDHLAFGKFKGIYHKEIHSALKKIPTLSPGCPPATSTSRTTIRTLRSSISAQNAKSVYLNSLLKKPGISYSNHKIKVNVPNLRLLASCFK